SRQGEFERAGAASSENVRIGEEGGDRQLVAWGSVYGAGALVRAGRFDEAIPRLRHAAALCRDVPDVISAAAADADLGLCYLRRDRLAEALELLEDTNRVLDERGLRSVACVPARVTLAEAYLRAAAREQGAKRQALLEKGRRSCQASWRMA